MPFYLFDEIDAALDPQYRTAVAAMIREQADKGTQFVCTTFRPEIVRKAEHLIGVSHVNKVSITQKVDVKEALRFVGDTTEGVPESAITSPGKKKIAAEAANKMKRARQEIEAERLKEERKNLEGERDNIQNTLDATKQINKTNHTCISIFYILLLLFERTITYTRCIYLKRSCSVHFLFRSIYPYNSHPRCLHNSLTPWPPQSPKNRTPLLPSSEKSNPLPLLMPISKKLRRLGTSPTFSRLMSNLGQSISGYSIKPAKGLHLQARPHYD